MLVDHLFLRDVNPDKRLDRFDRPLDVTDEIAVCIANIQSIRATCEQPAEMKDLPMRPAHRRETMTVG